MPKRILREVDRGTFIQQKFTTGVRRHNGDGIEKDRRSAGKLTVSQEELSGFQYNAPDGGQIPSHPTGFKSNCRNGATASRSLACKSPCPEGAGKGEMALGTGGFMDRSKTIITEMAGGSISRCIFSASRCPAERGHCNGHSVRSPARLLA